MPGKRVAIVHDWLVGGGAELVVEQLHKMYPDAPIFTSYASRDWQKRLDGQVITGFLQYWPFSWLRKYVGVLRIWWFKHLDLRQFDLVIVSTGNGEAKFVRPPKTATYICYCHSPVHYLWRHYDDYQKNPGFSFGGLGLKILAGPLRKKDYKAAQRPDFFIGNSTHISADIKKYYGRDSVTITPPVNTARFNKILDQPRSGFLTVSRLVPMKRIDVIVQACNKLSLPLTVVGRGPELPRLKKIAGPTISFDDDADDEAVNNYMQSAEAFLFASFEDFGVTPVEAMSAGTPVIAYKAGGALDYIIENKTGLFFEKQTTESLITALKKFDAKKFDAKEISNYAEQFNEAMFQKNIKNFINSVKPSK